MAETRVAHQDFHQAFYDGLVFGMSGARRDHGCAVVSCQFGVAGVEIGVVKVTLQDTLLEAVRDSDVRDTAIELEHPPMCAQPVAAARALGRPGEQQLAKAQSSHKHVFLADLASGQLDPLECVAGVADLDAFTRREITRSHGCLQILRKFPIKLLPEVGVRGEGLRLFLPEELQRMAQP